MSLKRQPFQLSDLRTCFPRQVRVFFCLSSQLFPPTFLKQLRSQNLNSLPPSPLGWGERILRELMMCSANQLAVFCVMDTLILNGLTNSTYCQPYKN